MDAQLFTWIGAGATALFVAVNLVDAAIAAYEKYAASTPEPEDDERARKMRAAVDSIRDFVDAAVRILRPFSRR